MPLVFRPPAARAPAIESQVRPTRSGTIRIQAPRRGPLRKIRPPLDVTLLDVTLLDVTLDEICENMVCAAARRPRSALHNAQAAP
jgi:hypothetical protein